MSNNFISVFFTQTAYLFSELSHSLNKHSPVTGVQKARYTLYPLTCDIFSKFYVTINGISSSSIIIFTKSIFFSEIIASWYETSLPTLLSQHNSEDIYNADEFGLFYQCLPNKTVHLKSDSHLPKNFVLFA